MSGVNIPALRAHIRDLWATATENVAAGVRTEPWDETWEQRIDQAAHKAEVDRLFREAGLS